MAPIHSGDSRLEEGEKPSPPSRLEEIPRTGDRKMAPIKRGDGGNVKKGSNHARSGRRFDEKERVSRAYIISWGGG